MRARVQEFEELQAKEAVALRGEQCQIRLGSFCQIGDLPMSDSFANGTNLPRGFVLQNLTDLLNFQTHLPSPDPMNIRLLVRSRGHVIHQQR
jgi:hypothetical protein